LIEDVRRELNEREINLKKACDKIHDILRDYYAFNDRFVLPLGQIAYILATENINKSLKTVAEKTVRVMF